MTGLPIEASHVMQEAPFLLSNVLWGAWGVHSGALSVVVVQVCLAAMNIRGAMQTESAG